MNGDCKSYKMNEPMTWADFQSMPDDLKVTYIKLVQQKFDVPGTYLAKMFGIGQRSVSFELRRIGLHSEHRSGKKTWKKEEFLAWISGARGVCVGTDADNEDEAKAEDTANEEPKATPEASYKIPETGSMVFEGDIRAILASVGRLLEGAKVHLSVTWDVLEDDDE